jgi:hypothetical protein
MQGKTRERWMELCERAANEQNPETFLFIRQELISLLDEKGQRLSKHFPLGKYEYDGELAVGKMVVVPSGQTYEIQSFGKNTTSSSGEPFDLMSIWTKRSSLAADAPGIVPLLVPGQLGGLRNLYADVFQCPYCDATIGRNRDRDRRRDELTTDEGWKAGRRKSVAEHMVGTHKLTHSR